MTLPEISVLKGSRKRRNLVCTMLLHTTLVQSAPIRFSELLLKSRVLLYGLRPTADLYYVVCNTEACLGSDQIKLPISTYLIYCCFDNLSSQINSVKNARTKFECPRIGLWILCLVAQLPYFTVQNLKKIYNCKTVSDILTHIRKCLLFHIYRNINW